MPTGASVQSENGLLVIENTSSDGNNWDLQLAVGSGFAIAKGLDYKYTITYKVVTEQANPSVSLGFVAVYPDEVAAYGVALTKSDDFETLTQTCTNVGFSTADAGYVKWQSRSLVGTIYIKKVEVIEIIPDAPQSDVTYELTDVTPKMYVKNYGENEPSEATPNSDGEYTLTDGVGDALTWSAQFWIAGEYALPEGRKFKVEFDYKASDAQTVPTQAHAVPGTYNYWSCIGDVSFTDGWKHFEKEVTIEGDMGKNGGWQSIAFNMHRGSQVDGDTYTGSATTYYIKNVTLKEDKVVGEGVAFSVGSIGWASYSSTKAVSLGSVKGYAAKYNGSSVELTAVTEVPANNAVLIEGAGKHSFPVVTSATAITDNDLKVSDGNVEGDGTIYVLANGTDGVGFYKLATDEKVPAGKGYLKITGNSPEFIGFGGAATGINDVRSKKADRGEVYNLAGQRVAQPTKGLYIVNGKKVIIK
jgi:hypothetical protein